MNYENRNPSGYKAGKNISINKNNGIALAVHIINNSYAI